MDAASYACTSAFERDLSPTRAVERIDFERATPPAPRRRRGWLVRRFLVVADVVALISAFAAAEIVYPKIALPSAFVTWPEALIFLVSLPGWIVVAKLYGLYDHESDRTDHSTADDFVPLFHMVVVCTGVFWFGARVTGLATPAPGKLMSFVVVAVVLLCAFRAFARAISHRRVAYVQNTLIVGAGDVGQRIAQKLINHPEYGINLVGFVDEKPRRCRPDLEHVPVFGSADYLPRLVAAYDVERVIIAFSNEPHRETLAMLRRLKDLDVQIDIVPASSRFLGRASECIPSRAFPSSICPR